MRAVASHVTPYLLCHSGGGGKHALLRSVAEALVVTCSIDQHRCRHHSEANDRPDTCCSRCWHMLSLSEPLCCVWQVPNIRFNVAKMLERLVPLLEAQVMDQTVRPVLQELTEDPDTDVRFYASQALVRYRSSSVQTYMPLCCPPLYCAFN